MEQEFCESIEAKKKLLLRKFTTKNIISAPIIIPVHKDDVRSCIVLPVMALVFFLSHALR